MIWQGGYAAMDWLGGEWPEGVLPVPADLPSLAAVLSQPDLRLSVSQTLSSQSARPSARTISMARDLSSAGMCAIGSIPHSST